MRRYLRAASEFRDISVYEKIPVRIQLFRVCHVNFQEKNVPVVSEPQSSHGYFPSGRAQCPGRARAPSRSRAAHRWRSQVTLRPLH